MQHIFESKTTMLVDGPEVESEPVPDLLKAMGAKNTVDIYLNEKSVMTVDVEPVIDKVLTLDMMQTDEEGHPQ